MPRRWKDRIKGIGDCTSDFSFRLECHGRGYIDRREDSIDAECHSSLSFASHVGSGSDLECQSGLSQDDIFYFDRHSIKKWNVKKAIRAEVNKPSGAQ
ncbi:hypothetical protein TNCV_3810301 [Trichonephila clavipes]|nr:hypothetical protein TNCV_3810301 [Trichonephila clavipes]